MAEDIKVGEVYYLLVRVTNRNVNMEREYLAVEPVGMEVPELVLSPDGTRLHYVKAEQLVLPGGVLRRTEVRRYEGNFQD